MTNMRYGPDWPPKLKNVTVTHGGPNWHFTCLDFLNTYTFCIFDIVVVSLNSGFSSSSNVYITATRKWCPVLKAALGGDPEIASTVLVHQWRRICFPQRAILTEESLWCFSFVFLDPEIATSVLVHQRFVSLQQEQSWLRRAFDVAVRSFKLALAIFLWNNLVQPAFLSHTIHLTTFAKQKNGLRWHRS